MMKAKMAELQDERERLKEIISILNKHELVKGLSPHKLRAIIEDLGPTFIKLGQIISSRTDIIPKAYCDELKLLRANVSPMPYEEVESILEEAFGESVGKLFHSFDRKPIGSASIAQVHAAILPNGEKAVLKIQRRGIYDIMSHDMTLLHRASKLIKRTPGLVEVVDFDKVLDEMWMVAKDEMNFLTEASNAERFYQLNKDYPCVTCPIIYREYTTSQVMTMEYIDGLGISDKDTLLQNGYDLEKLGTTLIDNYLKQIIDDGFFHADPHQGNIRIRKDEIVWIDLGMVGHLSARDQKLLRDAIQAVATKDVNTIIDVILALGKCKNRIDRNKLYDDMDNFLLRYGDMEMGSINIADIFEDLFAIITNYEITLPASISMLARGLATIEGVIADISPAVSIMKVATKRLSSSVLKNINVKEELSRQGFMVYQSAKKTLEIPSLMSDTLKMAVKGQTKINLELHTDAPTTKFLHDLMNKLIAGILVVGLLIGSSLLCTTSMQPKILGIPALGVLGYLIALFLSIWVFFNIHKRK